MENKNTIDELNNIIDELPSTFRTFKRKAIIAESSFKAVVFSSYSKKYNSNTYCLLPFKPISKLLSYDEVKI